MTQSLQVKLLHPDAKALQAPVHPGDVGYDLFLLGDHVLQPGERRDLPTGVAIAMDGAIYARITGRSSSVRRGLIVSEGILDSGYRGPLFVFVENATDQPVRLVHGERIAQLILAWAVRRTLVVVDDLPESARGAAGLGSTGA